MKIKIRKSELLASVQMASIPTATGTDTNTGAHHLSFHTEGDGLVVTGTDFDVSVAVTGKADVLEHGGFTILAQDIRRALKGVPAGETITLIDEGERVGFEAGACSATLEAKPFGFGLHTKTTPECVEDNRFEFGPEVMRDLLAGAYAVATAPDRYYLQRLMIAADDPTARTVRAVSTDGHRLAMYEAAKPRGFDDLPRILIETLALKALCRATAKNTEPVRFYAMRNARIKDGPEIMKGRKILPDMAMVINVDTPRPVEIRFRVAGGDVYPEWERVVPHVDGGPRITVDRKALLDAAEALEKSATFTTKNNQNKTEKSVAIDADGDTLTIAHANGASTIQCEVDGGPIHLGVNATYLKEAVASMPTDEIEIGFVMETREKNKKAVYKTLAEAPFLIRPSRCVSPFAVIMPVRVGDKLKADAAKAKARADAKAADNAQLAA